MNTIKGSSLALMAILGLLAGLVSAAAGGMPTTVPDIGYLRIDRDYQNRIVVHWAGTVDPDASGTFTLNGPGVGPVCTGIGQQTDCNCRWDPYGDDFWAGCTFEDPDPFLIPGWGGRCLADLWWVDGGRFTQVAFITADCFYSAYLPMVGK